MCSVKRVRRKPVADIATRYSAYVSQDNRITIPAPVRNYLGIGPEDIVEFFFVGGTKAVWAIRKART